MPLSRLPISVPKCLRLRTVGCVAVWLVAASPVTAQQVAVTPTIGISGNARQNHWMPIRLAISNAGGPKRVDVIARISGGPSRTAECRLGERNLAAGANQVHTLYAVAPTAFSRLAVEIEVLENGRSVAKSTHSSASLPASNPLVLGVPNAPMATADLGLTVGTRGATRDGGPGGPDGDLIPLSGRVQSGQNAASRPILVGLPAEELPDRWQGLDAVDAVVVSEFSERDLLPTQIDALTDYVQTGGTLVVVGGANWRWLSTGFLAPLLPVKATGSGWSAGLPGLGPLAPRGGSIPLVESKPLPGAQVLSEEAGRPLVAAIRRGVGQVLFIAFDPASPALRDWDGAGRFWQDTFFRTSRPADLFQTTRADARERRGSGGTARLCDAVYAISQLDIPAFYQVALFLVAYVLVLVPVNYFVLTRLDRRELAWITTPVIVVLFSLAAYFMGYRQKGGNTLLVQTGLIETRAGQSFGRMVGYSGLFSPRKVDYRMSVGTGGPRATLLGEPNYREAAGPIRTVYTDDPQLEQFTIDMWAMRVIKSDGLASLGGGVTGRINGTEFGPLTGEIRNDGPFALHDCWLVRGTERFLVGTVEPGKTAPISSALPVTVTQYPPPAPASEGDGSGHSRLEQAFSRPLAGSGGPRPSHPVLFGWVRDPLLPLDIEGVTPKVQSSFLMAVHLDQSGR